MYKILLMFFGFSHVFSQTVEKIEPTNSCTNRHENSVVAIGSDIFLIGGRGIKPVEKYSEKTNSWTKLVPTPIEMHHFQAIAFQKEIWVIGAFTGRYPHEKPIDRVYIFNPTQNTWREGPLIPEGRRRGGAGAFVKNQKIYLVCGIIDGHWDGHVSWFDEYDPKTGIWKILPEAPHARDHISAAWVSNKLILAGGRRSSANINKVMDFTEPAVDVFDFKSSTWSTLDKTQDIPTQRAGAAAATLGKKILVIGGESGTQVPAHSEIEILDTETMTWLPPLKLHQGRHGTGIGKIKNKVYIVAGSGNRGGGPELNTIERIR
jgi:hypothetical protein